MRRIGWSPNILTLDSDPTDDLAQPIFVTTTKKLTKISHNRFIWC